MPLYSYRCPCGNEFDELRSMQERKSCECPKCGATAEQRIVPVKIDYLGMGVSLAFPTAADKWAKMHEKSAKSGEYE